MNRKDCIHDNYDEFDYYKTCGKVCPLECTTSTYGITAQSITYITSPEKTALARSKIGLHNNITDLSDQVLEERILSLYIFYEDLKYTEITQIAKTTETDLVSKVGGK